MGLAAESKEQMRPLREMHVRFPPRIREVNKAMTYSNAGIALLGLVVELISGQEFGSYMKQHIFDMMEMKNSHYSFGNMDEASLKNFIWPMIPNGDSFIRIDQWVQWNNLAPAGSVVTCGADMANYMIAQLNGGAFNGKRILTPESVSQMQTQQFTNAPGLLGIGFPWFIKRHNNIEYFQHSGDLPGYHTNLALFPEHKVGVMLFSVGTNAAFVDESLKKFIQATIKEFKCDPPLQTINGLCFEVMPPVVPAPGWEKRAALYEGCYILFRYEHTSWIKFQKWFFPSFCVEVRKNSLLVKSSTQQFDIFEESIGKFRFGVNVQDKTYLEFPRNETTFSFGLDLQNNARYFFIDSTAFERNTETSPLTGVVLGEILLLVTAIGGVVHLIYLLVEAIMVAKHEKKERQYIMHEFLGDYLLNDDEDYSESNTEKMARDIHTTKKGMYDTSALARRKWKIMSGYQALLVVLLIFSSILNFGSLVAMLINFVIINPSKMLLQNGIDMQLFSSIPVFTTILDLFLILGYLSMIAWRVFGCIKLKLWKMEIFGTVFLVLYGIGLAINLACCPLFMALNWYTSNFLA